MNSRKDKIEEARERLLQGIGVPEKAEFVVDEFQKQAISAAANGEDTLVVAPTGSGKTFIAVQAIDAYLHMGTKSVYTTPLKALSNTKYNELRRKFSPKHSVGLLTGDRKIDMDSDVVVATTEIYRNELYAGEGRYSLVVLDEVHFIADPQRGAVWEESIILTPQTATLLMLSASISNANEIARWLEGVRGKKCRVIIESERPVELRYGFLHPDLGVLPLTDEHGNVLREVSNFYGDVGLDASGRRLVRKHGGGGYGRRRRGNQGNRRSGRGSSSSSGQSSNRRRGSRGRQGKGTKE